MSTARSATTGRATTESGRLRYRIALVGVLLLAWALLLYRLDTAPPGFQHDQTFAVWDAQDVLQGRLSFYFFRNFGRDPVFIYSAAAAIGLLHAPLVWVLHFASILWGFLALVLTFKLARRSLTPWAALVATILMAGSFWFLFMARLGLEPIALLALVTAMVLCLDIGLASGSRRKFAWAGVWGSLAVYTYLAGRAFYLLPLVLLVHQFVVRPAPDAGGDFAIPSRRTRVGGLLLTFGLMLLVTAPLLLFLRANASGVDLRVGELGGPLVALREGQLGPLLANAQDALRGLIWAGSPQLPYHYNLPGRPALQPVWAAFFLVGVAVALWRWRRRAEFTLLCVLLLSLAPSLITSGDALYVRSVTALPAVCILVVYGLWALLGGLQRWLRLAPGRPSWPRVVLGCALAILLIWHLAESGSAYFSRWAEAEPVQRIYNADFRALAEVLRRSPPAAPVIIGTDRLLDLDEQTYRFYTPGDPDREWFLLPNAPPLPAGEEALYAWPGSAQHFSNSWELLRSAAREPFSLHHPVQGYILMSGFTVTRDALQAQLAAAGVDDLRPDVRFGDFLRLAGAGARPGTPGLQLTTLWEALDKWPRGQLAGPKAAVALVDGSGYTWSQVDFETDLPFRTWQPGQQFVQVIDVPVPADAPPGRYGVRLVLYEDTQGAFSMTRAQRVIADPPIVASVELTSTIGTAPPPPEPVAVAGDTAVLRALGQWNRPAILVAGVPAQVRVSWQAGEPIATNDLQFRVRAIGPDGTPLWDAPADPAETTLPAVWPAGQTYRLAFPVMPALDQPGTVDASLEVCVQRMGVTITCAGLGSFPVINHAPLLALDQPPSNEAGATWGDQLELIGYDVAPATNGITVTLVWRTQQAPDVPLRRFVHVVDGEGTIIGQEDGAPGTTPVPMPYWRSGEIIIDQVPVMVPAGKTPAGAYVGLYDPVTGVRLPVRSAAGDALPDDRYSLSLAP